MDASLQSIENGMETPKDARSSSIFLQDMIKEKRSQTQRLGRRDISGSSHLRDVAGREFHSSPIAPSRDKATTANRKVSASRPQAAPKEMGLREMQEHLSRLDKQNFDLKLEIFHRRQKCEALESKIERLEPLEKENEELRARNEDLSIKLDKNDQDIEMREIAIEEAVGMICELEAKVEDYEKDLGRYRSIVDAVAPPPPVHAELQNSPTLIHSEHQNTASNPSKAHDLPSIERSGSTSRHPAIRRVASIASGPKSPLRPPSFLHDERKSNTALRSLYSSGNPSIASFNRDSGAYSDSELDEEMDRQIMASPRLSILSETGFSSIMGHTREDGSGAPQPPSPTRDEELIIPNAGHEERVAQRQARINKWVEENNRQEPPKTPVRQPSKKQSSARFSSIGELLLEKPATIPTSPRSQQSKALPEKHASDHSSSNSRSPTKSLRKSARAHEKLQTTVVTGSPFNSAHLPPTPETMSTATIGGGSSTQSIITERSLADGAVLPTSINSGRPNSSDRREDRRLSQSHRSDGTTVDHSHKSGRRRGSLNDFHQDDAMSTKVEQGEVSAREQAGFMSGSAKATRFLGADAPRRPALNTHVTDMMFNGDGFSPKQAARTVSYPSAPRSRDRSYAAPSPSSQRSSGVGSSKTVTSPRRTQPSPSKTRDSAPSPPQHFADMDQDFDNKPPRHTSSLRFRLPKRHAALDTNTQSVTSRIFKRNRAPAANGQEVEEDVQNARPSSGPRPGRSSTIPAAPRPGTADGSISQEHPRPNADNRRWTLMRRHSAVLDDSFVPDLDKDEETGLSRVTESRATLRAGEDGMFKNAKAKLANGFGLRR